MKQLGFRSGNWLSAEQSSEVLKHACGDSMRAKRDYAMLAMLFGCGFRRSELVGLELDEIQMRQGHWAAVDLVGEGGHIRTVPIPDWVKASLDQWTAAARVSEGRIFRAVARTGKVWGKRLSQNVVWYVVKSCCERAGLEHIAPHDLRRTCAKLCHSNGGELEQIQFLLGHASVQTTGEVWAGWAFDGTVLPTARLLARPSLWRNGNNRSVESSRCSSRNNDFQG